MRVHLKLEGVVDPITESLLNVSLGGMAVAIRRPPPVGSLVAFEFDLGEALIEGTGEVVWVHPIPDHPMGKSDVGVRFRYLSPGSRERIFRLVQWYTGQDSTPGAEQVAEALASGVLSPAGSTTPGRIPASRSPVLPLPLDDAGEMVEMEDLTVRGTALPVPEPAEPSAPPATFPTPLSSNSPAEPTSWPVPALGAQAWAPEAEPAGRASEEPAEVAPEPGWEPRWRQPASEPAEAEAEEPEALPRGGPSFAQVAAPRRRSLLPLFLLGMTLGLVGFAGYLFRDTVLGWLGMGNRPAPAQPAASSPAPNATPPAANPEPARPAAGSLPANTSTGTTLVEDVGAGSAASAPAEKGPDAAAEGSETATETAPQPQAARPEPETQPAAPQPAPASPQPTPASPASSNAAGPRARSIEQIRWQASGGATTLEIQASGRLDPARVSFSRLEGTPPRLLVKLGGIDRLYKPTAIEAKTSELARIRSGLHLSPGETSLHVVLDLTSPAVTLAEKSFDGETLRLRLVRR